MARRISGSFYDETEELADYITSSWKKNADPPVLDGLFGGKACYRSWADESKPTIALSKMKCFTHFPFLEQLTVRKNKDKKYNSETMHNGEPIDECSKPLCEIKMCRYKKKYIPDPDPVFVACNSYHWAAWGKWTQCDLK